MKLFYHVGAFILSFKEQTLWWNFERSYDQRGFNMRAK